MEHYPLRIPVKDNRKDSPFVFDQAYLGLFRIFGKGSNSVYLVLDILRHLLGISPVQNLDHDRASALSCRGGNLLHTLQILYRLLHRQNDPLFNIFGGGSGIRYKDLDNIQLYIRKDLLLDVVQKQDPAEKTDEHNQVRGNRITSHPGNRTPCVLFR